jgi:ribulose-phosphate 3-epimerase
VTLVPTAAELIRARRAGDHPPILSVGLMAANLARIDAQIADVVAAGVEMVHVDVMDGHFCGPLTVGPTVIRALPSSVVKDVHLLIDDPMSTIESYLDAGADMVTFHVEAARQPRAVLRRIAAGPRSRERQDAVLRGVALNPSTPLEVVEPLLGDLDYILLLAIDPGWPGQSFAPSTVRRLERLRRLVAEAEVEVVIGIDGGVTRDNLVMLAGLGPDVVVSGSAIFDGTSAASNVRSALGILAGSGRPTPAPGRTAQADGQ